jgi:selenide,water dikinase
VDVFTPVLDDPYDYGRVAAVNSLSDVYAMGARPISALNVVGFPDFRLPLDVLVEMLRGGTDAASAVGVPVIGGHTLKNSEPFYGLAVTGIVHPDRIVLKTSGRAGDVLVLTKPLGIGVLTTALKNEVLPPELLPIVTDVMTTPNAAASELMLEHNATAATDITGFGLIGGLCEMVAENGLTAEISFSALSFIPGLHALAEGGAFPGGAKSNLKAYEGDVEFDDDLAEWQRLMLTDPQTSGGLVVSFPPDKIEAALEAFSRRSVPAVIIGRFVPRDGVKIVVGP